MSSAGRLSLLTPLGRGLAQLDDPVFLGVVARSVGWSIVCFAVLHVLAIWIVHRLLDLHGLLAWAVDILSTIGASFLALWLFLPVAAVIGTFYFDRIAGAVERRFYPGLPAPRGAPVIEQLWDGVAVGLRVLALNALALVLMLLVPGIGLVLGWMITGSRDRARPLRRRRDAADAPRCSRSALPVQARHCPGTRCGARNGNVYSDPQPADSGDWHRRNGPHS